MSAGALVSESCEMVDWATSLLLAGWRLAPLPAFMSATVRALAGGKETHACGKEAQACGTVAPRTTTLPCLRSSLPRPHVCGRCLPAQARQSTAGTSITTATSCGLLSLGRFGALPPPPDLRGSMSEVAVRSGRTD